MTPLPLLGRATDLHRVLGLLSRGRAVALVGPPGIGKTRLAEAVAERWAGAVGRAQGTRIPDLRGSADPLVVVDRAEAFADQVPALLRQWDQEVPGVRILLASRVRPPGIDPVPVGPLDPDDAVALYLDRVGALAAVDPAAARRMVDALDAIPEALERAADRARLYPPDLLIPALELGDPLALDPDLAPTWDGLGAEPKDALAAASVFRGAFDVEAFCAVAEAGPDVLDALLDASLARAEGPGRVRLYRAIRRFVARQVPDREGPARRHAAWVLAAGQARLPEVRQHGRLGPLVELQPELEAIVDRDGADGAQAALLLCELGSAGATVDDPVPRLTAIPPDHQTPLGLARAAMLSRTGKRVAALDVLRGVRPQTPAQAFSAAHLTLTARMALGQVGLELDAAMAAMRLAEEALGRRRFTGRIAEASYHRMRGDRALAVEVLEEARASLPGLTDPQGALEAEVSAHLGHLHADDPNTAAGYFERAMELHRQGGNLENVARMTVYLAEATWDLGNLRWAAELAARGAEAARAIGSVALEANAELLAAGIAAEQRDEAGARAALERVRASRATTGVLSGLRGLEGLLAHLGGRLPEALAAYRAALGPQAGPDPSDVLFLTLCEALVAGRLAEPVPMGSPREEGLVQLVREALSGAPSEETRRIAGQRPSHHARLLLILTQSPTAVASDGGWFERRGERIDLRGRPVLRRLVGILAEAGPGALVTRSDLVAGCWPGERTVGKSADARLYVAVNSLRKLGLAEALRTGEVDGELAYGLAADVRLGTI